MKLPAKQHLTLLGFVVLWFGSSLRASVADATQTTDLDQTSHGHGRSKRTLVYTFNSCSGILVALSIPLLVTGRNIFMSYNFEANYNMPTDSTDFTQGILKKGDNDQIQDPAAARRTRRDTTQRRSSLGRKKFYRTIELNLQRYGYAGKRCILRMICELAETPLHRENGVLGDLLQLIFTPSLSQDENLPGEFRRAEQLGREQGNCSKYLAHCPTNPIDLTNRRTYRSMGPNAMLLACWVALGWAGTVLSAEFERPGRALERQKRTLVFTSDSATGILFAVSVPLIIPGRNIFMAYNFEANYGMPGDASDFTQGVLKKVDNDQIQNDAASDNGAGAESERALRDVTGATPRAFTRKKLYRTIELNLVRYGYDGKKCILRMICELASYPVRETNGILGDLLQLVFTPSGSHYEKLPSEFYLAEELGVKKNCVKYSKHCPKNPLDMISLML
uniref:Uncharacterized protein n=1 Tax=Anopheles dirus TaxID=7168 RepID=A0A182N6E5_9DIPT